MLERTVFLQSGPPSLAQLIEQGVRLWHEEAERRPSDGLAHLWDTAAAFMSRPATSARLDVGTKKRTRAAPHKPSAFSAHTAELLILGDNLLPRDWDSTDPYPYQGLFISSFYFHESQSLLAEQDTDAAWASLTKAYYYLGMNSSALTAHESAKLAAEKRHSENSKELRGIVVRILSELQNDKSLRSAAKATKCVIQTIESNPEYLCVLVNFDAKTTKKSSLATDPKTAGDRLAERLQEWSEPNSRYPDIAKAFLSFKQKKRSRKLP